MPIGLRKVRKIKIVYRTTRLEIAPYLYAPSLFTRAAIFFTADETTAPCNNSAAKADFLNR
jgi:hypothetical protein